MILSLSLWLHLSLSLSCCCFGAPRAKEHWAGPNARANGPSNGPSNGPKNIGPSKEHGQELRSALLHWGHAWLQATTTPAKQEHADRSLFRGICTRTQWEMAKWSDGQGTVDNRVDNRARTVDNRPIAAANSAHNNTTNRQVILKAILH